jgi:hypothetical protein
MTFDTVGFVVGFVLLSAGRAVGAVAGEDHGVIQLLTRAPRSP